MSARMFVAASTNQTKGVANILWLAGIQGDSDMLHQYVCVLCVCVCVCVNSTVFLRFTIQHTIATCLCLLVFMHLCIFLCCLR